MPIDYRVFLVLAPFMAGVVLLASLAGWRQRDRPGGRYLVGFAIGAFGYIVSNTLELLAASESWTLFWARTEHVWVESMPVTWTLFVLSFTGRSNLTKLRRFWPVLILPSADVVLTYTNSFHHLIWRSIRFVPVGHILGMRVVHGPAFFVFVVFAYGLFLGGLVVLAREFSFGRTIYRRQFLWITAGIIVPLCINAVYVFHLVRGLHKDFTPLGFAFGSLMFLFAVYGPRFLVLSPPSRTRLFDALPDGIVVLDDKRHIVDLNANAMQFLSLEEPHLGDSVYQHPRVAALFDRFTPADKNVLTYTSPGKGEESRHFEVSLIALAVKTDGRNGALLVIRDVTERDRLTEEIKTLRGIVPICANCKKVRDDDGFWRNVEAYVEAHSYAQFSHSLCPDCLVQLFPETRKPDD